MNLSYVAFLNQAEPSHPIAVTQPFMAHFQGFLEALARVPGIEEVNYTLQDQRLQIDVITSVMKPQRIGIHPAANAEIERLSGLLSAEKLAHSNTAQSIAGWKNKAENQKSEIEGFRVALEKERSEHGHTKKAAIHWKDKADNVADKLYGANEMLASLRATYAQLKKDHEGVKDAARATYRRLTGELAGANDALDSLRAELTTAQQEYSVVRTQVAGHLQDIVELVKERDALKIENGKLGYTIANLTAHRDHLQKSFNTVYDDRERLIGLNARLGIGAKQLEESRRAAVLKWEDAVRDADAYKGACDRLGKLIEEKDAVVKGMREQLAAADARADDRVAELESARDALLQALSTYQHASSESPEMDVYVPTDDDGNPDPEWGVRAPLNAGEARMMWEAEAYRALRETMADGNDDVPFACSADDGQDLLADSNLDEAMLTAMGWYAPYGDDDPTTPNADECACDQMAAEPLPDLVQLSPEAGGPLMGSLVMQGDVVVGEVINVHIDGSNNVRTTMRIRDPWHTGSNPWD